MKLGIVRLYTGESGKMGYYNIQEIGLAKELVKNTDLEVSIFILRKKNEYPDKEIIEIDKNIKIIYLPVAIIGNHGLLNPKDLEDFNLDMIQLNADNQLKSYGVIKWALKRNIPIYTYIGTIHSDSNNKIKGIISKLILKRNAKMMSKITNVAKTPKVLNELEKVGIRNSIVIPVGLDKENFRYINDFDKDSLKEKYYLPKNKKILLFVGRLEEYKKPFFTLDLIDYINQIDNKYHLLVVGNGTLKDKFMDYIEKKNLKNDVTCIEKIENKYMAELYSISDIFVNTNDKEIYGMSILESMYCGCPVVAKKAPGPEFIIENGKTGYVIEEFDKSLWYEKINDIVSNRDSFSYSSKIRIENNFLWSIVCDKYKELFNKLK